MFVCCSYCVLRMDLKAVVIKQTIDVASSIRRKNGKYVCNKGTNTKYTKEIAGIQMHKRQDTGLIQSDELLLVIIQ